MQQDLTDDISTLVLVMAWCRQVTSHYLNQCWPSSLTHIWSTRGRWDKRLQWNNYGDEHFIFHDIFTPVVNSVQSRVLYITSSVNGFASMSPFVVWLPRCKVQCWIWNHDDTDFVIHIWEMQIPVHYTTHSEELYIRLRYMSVSIKS